MKAQSVVRFVMVSCLMLVPVAARAQVASVTIAGVVKDTTGAVMPGVTVEAASPALIEKVRSVITDAQGQYKIVDLAPGTYTINLTSCQWMDCSSPGALPKTFVVIAGQTTTINISIDTGIR